MDVKVTFFMTGGWVESYPDDVKAIYEAGHDLGNHSERHKDMATIGAAEQMDELMSVHNKVKELTGYEMFLFRPPYGSYNNELITTAETCGYYPIQWSVDSLDWKDYGTDNIISTVCEHKALGCGAIILMHNGATYTADALETIITNIRDAGYEIVPISQLIYKEQYHLDVGGTQIFDGASPSGESTTPQDNSSLGETDTAPEESGSSQGMDAAPANADKTGGENTAPKSGHIHGTPAAPES